MLDALRRNHHLAAGTKCLANHIIGLSPSGGEDHFMGMYPDQSGNRLACRLNLRTQPPAKAVNGRRIAGHLQNPQHRRFGFRSRGAAAL